MAGHTPARGPRAHWLLLALGMLVLLVELCLQGYVAHVGDEGSGQPAATDAAGTAPAAVTGGGPVLRIGANGAVTSRGMPARTIALTFDDGPDPRWTPEILELLSRYGAHATFFEVGSRVNEYPEITREIVAQGSEVGSHTFTHPDLAAVPAWRRQLELNLTQNAIIGATGLRPTLVRPPYSATPDAVTGADFTALKSIGAAGYIVVLTNLDSQDWRRPGVAAIVKAATPADGAGAVVMMHDSGGDRAETVAALAELLPKLRDAGYRFQTVSQALSIPGDVPVGTAARLRGQALRLLQKGADWASRIMMVLMLVALVVSVLRLLLLAATVPVHLRRVRRRTPDRPRYLGPVSVIVPAYNESANIAATVRSLVASDYPRLEVIVVDDGSTDGTAEIVRRLGLPGVFVITQPNAGKPAALNNGIAHARGDLLVLVDGDTVFEPQAVGRLVQPFADPEVGAVAGNTKVVNRRRLLGRWQHLEYVMGFNLDRRLFEVGQFMATVPGAIGAFRREALADVGGLSADTLAEDSDLTMSIARCGWHIVYAGDAVAWTEAPVTVRQLWRQRYRWCYGTMQALWKHRPALGEPGAAGRFGRRALTYQAVFQILLPLTAPAVDVYAVYGLMFLPWMKVMAVWAGLVVLQALTAGYALRLDRESVGPLWTLPLQQIVYRQLMYLVVVQSAVMAVIGGRLRWHRMARTGAAAAHSNLPVGVPVDGGAPVAPLASPARLRMPAARPAFAARAPVGAGAPGPARVPGPDRFVEPRAGQRPGPARYRPDPGYRPPDQGYRPTGGHRPDQAHRRGAGYPPDRAPYRPDQGFPPDRVPYRPDQGYPPDRAPYRPDQGYPPDRAPYRPGREQQPAPLRTPRNSSGTGETPVPRSARWP